MPKKVFRVDANAILALGRNSIKDHTTAVVELIKNAYDADADRVELTIRAKASNGGLVRIADNGHGMSDQDIQDSWLRIGFSEKISNPTSARFGRRKTGEKGIGRLSADRLGSVLEVRTKSRSHAATGVIVDWTMFEGTGCEVGSIQLKLPSNPQPKIPGNAPSRQAATGTELLIRNLRQSWTSADIEKLHAELSLLLPPYPELAQNFELLFDNDVDPQFNGKIAQGKRTEGEIELSATLDKEGCLRYSLRFYPANDRTRRRTTKGKMAWSALAPDPASGAEPEPYQIGIVDIRLSYFVRRSDLLTNSSLSLTQLKGYLDRNAGVKIYRDAVRVKPYGDPTGAEADWLGLGDRKLKDPAGARRAAFKIAPNQLVGAIFTGRDISPGLVDSSSREGLIENDAFRQLKAVLMQCVILIESKYHEISVEKPRSESKGANAKAAVKSLAGSLSTLQTELVGLQKKISDDVSDDLAAVNEQIQLLIEQTASAKREIEEIADQNTVLRGLATVGIASAIFGHETSFAVSQAEAKIRIARGLLGKTPPLVSRATDRIDQGLEYMDRVSGWGKFAMTRVNKDKRSRRRISVSNIVSSILDEFEYPLQKSEVVLLRDIAEGVEAKTFAMDVEAVLINYLTNAYHEVKRHRGQRTVRVRLTLRQQGGRDGFELSVADSGGGVPPEHLERIWEPLFSTRTDERGRPSGTGLGLSIVKSAVEELRGEVSVKTDAELGGAMFSAWMPRGN